MKILIFLVAVFLLLWLLRGGSSRRKPPPPRPPAAGSAGEPQPMLACAKCGVHLPRDDALPGRGGVFCSEAHRKAFEQSSSNDR